MSQILIHSAFGVLEAKPMVLADIENDSVSESEFSNINSSRPRSEPSNQGDLSNAE